MDINDLAGQAVAFISTYLTDIASGVADRVKDSAIDRLYMMVLQRLRCTEIGNAAMEGLAENPTGARQQELATTAVAEEAAKDDSFVADLREALRVIVISQGGVDKAVVHRQINISSTGPLTVKKSVISTGKVDQSRRTNIKFGGIIAVAVLLFGTGSATYHINWGNETEERGSFGDAGKTTETPMSTPKKAPGFLSPYSGEKTISDTYDLFSDYGGRPKRQTHRAKGRVIIRISGTTPEDHFCVSGKEDAVTAKISVTLENMNPSYRGLLSFYKEPDGRLINFMGFPMKLEQTVLALLLMSAN